MGDAPSGQDWMATSQALSLTPGTAHVTEISPVAQLENRQHKSSRSVVVAISFLSVLGTNGRPQLAAAPECVAGPKPETQQRNSENGYPERSRKAGKIYESAS